MFEGSVVVEILSTFTSCIENVNENTNTGTDS